MNKVRHQHDLYQTPEKLTQELIERVYFSGTALECCAGNSLITETLKQDDGFRAVLESDLTWERNHPTDATQPDFWQYWRSHFAENYPEHGLSWVVTNPPFSQAHKILPLAFENCNIGVAFLLRSTYSEPCKNRADWLIENSDHLRYRFDINPRPQFRNEKGSDTATVTWFVYLKNWSWGSLGILPPFGYITDWKGEEKNA